MSKIQQRAEMITKIQGARDKMEDDKDGDVDMANLDDAEGWMDVDQDKDEHSPQNSGGNFPLTYSTSLMQLHNVRFFRIGGVDTTQLHMWCATPSSNAPLRNTRKHIKEQESWVNFSMNRRRPIPLYPYPPDSPREIQDKPPTPSDNSSDFPPIQILKTPDRDTIPSAPFSSVLKPPSRHSQVRLGNKNCVNTLHVSTVSEKHAKRPKPSLKRDRDTEIIDLTDDRPLKKKCIVDENNLDWLKAEVESIRDTMDHFSRDLDLRFAKIVRKVQQLT